MSWSCSRRSRLYSLAMLSKVSTTLGLSSASMAASESEFSISSSSKSPSPGAASPASPCSPPLPTLPRSGAPLNGVAPVGAAVVCASTGEPGTGGAPGGATIGWPSGPITGAGIGRIEVDDVAQQHLPLVELVAPDDDGLEGERTLAQAGDHRFAAGLDALGNGDLALARQKLHGGQHRVDLVMGHVAAFLGGADELLDRGVGEVEQRQRRVRRLGRLFFRRFFLFFFLLRCLGLARHTSSPGDAPAGETPITTPPLPYAGGLERPIGSAGSCLRPLQSARFGPAEC